MTKIKIFIAAVLGLLLMVGCTTSQMIVSDISPTTIQQLDYFAPYAEISVIEKKNQATANREFSVLTENLIDSILQTKKGYKVNDRIVAKDDATNNLLKKEVITLINASYQKKALKTMPLPTTIKQLMDNSNSDFALAVFSSGFTRNKGNYGKQIAKGIGVGILTLGLFAPTPVKSNSTIHFLICDKKNNNVALYRRSFLEKEPLSNEVINQQIDKVLKEYFVR